jgi:hypothetical protein
MVDLYAQKVGKLVIFMERRRQATQFYESMVNWQVGGIIQRMAKEGGCDVCCKRSSTVI